MKKTDRGKKKVLNYCHQTMDHIHKISRSAWNNKGKKIMNWQLGGVFFCFFFQEARNNTSRAVSLHHISTGAVERQPFISSLRGAPVFARRGGGISMEIFKYLQHKAWTRVHTSKPQSLGETPNKPGIISSTTINYFCSILYWTNMQ